MKLVTLIFLTTFCIINADAAVSQARQIAIQPQTLAVVESFNHNNKTMLPNQVLVGGCSYTAIIQTSCSSPPLTTDRISLEFGDAYGNKLYVERLDNLAARRFLQCATDTIRIDAEICIHQICYFALIRYGMDGWAPEIITIYGPNSAPIHIVYSTFLPQATWFGINQCSIL